MRRWAFALCMSLALHSLLLLAPGSSEVRPNLAGEFRLVLRAGGSAGGAAAPAVPEKAAPEKPAAKPVEETSKAQPEPPKAVKKPAAKKSPPKEKAPPSQERPAQPVKRPVETVEAPPKEAGVAEAATAGGGREGTGIGAAGAGVSPGSPGAKPGPVDVGTLRILSQPPPEYPLFSRRRREEGVVRLLLTIRSGRVAEASVSSGSGSARLDEAALKAVKLWRFDHPGEVRASAAIVFRLD